MSNLELIKKSLPKGFHSTKVKYIVDKSKYYQIGDGDHGSISPSDYLEDGIPYIRVQNLSYSGKFEKSGLVFISKHTHSKNLKSRIIPGDILIAKTGATVGKLCLVGDEYPEFNTTSSVGKITVDQSRYLPKYILYHFQSQHIQDLIKQISYQKSAQPGFNIDDLVDFPVFAPKIEEQKNISIFLDKKTEQIDLLIEKVEKKIKLLIEQRTSLINHYVTKGLVPNVEMKDSSLEAIGKIPKHWNFVRLASLGSFSKGKNITKDELVEEGQPVILYSHIYTTYSRVTSQPKYYVSSEKFLESTKISKNTFLFTSSGESVDEIGKALLYNGEREVGIGGDMVVFSLKSCKNISPDFLSYSLNSLNCQYQKSSMSRGEIVVHVYEKQLKDILIALPPISEQIEITKILDQYEKNSSKLIDCLKRKIEILRELRKSIISSVVTGKVNIPKGVV